MPDKSAFKTSSGEAAFLAAYDAALGQWPVPFEELDIPSRFGSTHVIAGGPKDAPPLVLLHGYAATSTMWSPYIVDFTKRFRVYAIDVMGQCGKSVPDEPIRSAADYVEWLSATLDTLHADKVFLVGMSFGATVALTYAMALPQRVQRLVLLSPGGIILPFSRQFIARGMLMTMFPARAIVNWFMRWMSVEDNPGDNEGRRVGEQVVELMHLGLKHFRFPKETTRAALPVFSDEQLRSVRVPTFMMIGEREVICDPAKALDRARRLIPDFEGQRVPRASHDMAFTEHGLVAARVLEFLTRTRTSERAVA
jgi:pimeloyl-ACP methyl ester carboxylesterase